ncbi:queuine tRNA-ribosyltransferase accessory subunit 2 isoform X1 [Colletes gigas]|uniref:queuine tRNA-ribosyltransferase accessory subunit 2 isoform X1 n=1 Tax=Colletes gigas TaxID=935657 RepID=UPI001C9B3942|nr:queuine tRNA-ribosyltransferase accessory subunit 2 isoform X1 [Colletes gigas]XP_043248265.1 queuine tRNA-ribosyltransferase accessory subunit 2 isoform X1 [Colletes gigas]
MKFITNSIQPCAARIGTLMEFERIPDVSFETPLVLIYTKSGCVPHLTKDVFKMVTSNQHMLSVSLASTISIVESVKDTNTNLANFICMKEYINFLTIHDTAQPTPSGFQKLDSISLWARNGRQVLTADKYMDIIETFKPDFYVALCDGDTNIDSKKKRTKKAAQRSKTLFEQCLARHTKSKILESVGILGAIEGGYDIETRTMSINDLKDKPIIGYVIDGLHNNGPNVQNISLEQIKEIMKHTASLLPIEKLKVSLGCWNPLTVLDLIELGVDIFDTSYPYIAVENSEGLTFLCDHSTCNNVAHVIGLAEKSFCDRYEDDFSPICSHCECLACKNHTRAYLHHLHNTKEMLCAVLLMIHNIHHYLEFFKAIRENIRNNTFDQYKKTITLKFPKRNVVGTNSTDVEDVKSTDT